MFIIIEIFEKEIKFEVLEFEILEKKELVSFEMEFDFSIVEKKEVFIYRKLIDIIKEEIIIIVIFVEG